MRTIIEGMAEALRLIASLDPELVRIVGLSLEVSGAALAISALLGIPFGAWLGMRRFFGRGVVINLLYTGMGFPPVVVGLFVYLILSRSGPLGGLEWLFTPQAMIIAQVVIAFPLVAGLTMVAVIAVDPLIREQARSLGATEIQATMALLREARSGVAAALVAGFGGIISEVGAVMIVGGNIQGSTRVLTTAIVLETRKGNFDLAMALGFVLLAIAFVINLTILRLQWRRS